MKRFDTGVQVMVASKIVSGVSERMVNNSKDVMFANEQKEADVHWAYIVYETKQTISLPSHKRP